VMVSYHIIQLTKTSGILIYGVSLDPQNGVKSREDRAGGDVRMAVLSSREAETQVTWGY
jgi:hypothetical protein